MENKISVSELAEIFVKEKKLTKARANKFVRLFFEVLGDSLAREKTVKVKGLGTFKLIDVADRESVNVNTAERILIEGHSKISFTPEASLRDRVNKPFAAFETVILNEGIDLDVMTRLPKDGDSTEDSISPEQPVVPVEITEESAVDKTPASADSDQSVISTLATVPDDLTERTCCDEQINTLKVEEERVENLEVTIPQEESEQTLPAEEAEVEVEDKGDAVENDEEDGGEDAVAPLSALSGGDGTKLPSDKSNVWKHVLRACVVLLLMALSYFAGYYRWLCPVCDDVKVVQKEKVSKKGEADARKQEAAQKDKVQEPAPRPRPEDQYAQVPGGKYLIIGTKGTREMKVGDTLYKMAREEYGDKEFAKYIIVHNNFSNPDVIPLGYEVKLPLLK